MKEWGQSIREERLNQDLKEKEDVIEDLRKNKFKAKPLKKKIIEPKYYKLLQDQEEKRKERLDHNKFIIE